jgi:hypothetical protein
MYVNPKLLLLLTVFFITGIVSRYMQWDNHKRDKQYGEVEPMRMPC